MGTQLPLPQPPDDGAAVAAPAAAPSVNAGGNPDGMPVQPRRVPRWPEPDAKTLELAKSVSPMTYIRPGLSPTFIVNGDSDPTFDPTQSSQLKKALDAAGVPNGQVQPLLRERTGSLEGRATIVEVLARRPRAEAWSALGELAKRAGSAIVVGLEIGIRQRPVGERGVFRDRSFSVTLNRVRSCAEVVLVEPP